MKEQRIQMEEKRLKKLQEKEFFRKPGFEFNNDVMYKNENLHL